MSTTATATDAETIEFFQRHGIDFVNKEDHRVHTVDGCHLAFREQLFWATCDDEMIVESELDEAPGADPDEILFDFRAALRSPEIASKRGEAWFITYHRAAELLGTTVESVMDEIEPGFFTEIRLEKRIDHQVIELFREHFVVQDEQAEIRKPETIDECLEILQSRAAGVSRVLAVSIQGEATNLTDAEIIQYFREYEIELFDEDDPNEYRPPRSIEECRSALADQLQLAIGDDKELVFRAYYGALRDPSTGAVTHDFRYLHRAAALLGTTVDAELSGIAPRLFPPSAA